MGKVRLTPRAESDLFEIWTTIAADNIRAADGVIQKIMHKIDLASDQPLMGAARAELSSPHRPYFGARPLSRNLRAAA